MHDLAALPDCADMCEYHVVSTIAWGTFVQQH